MKFEHQITVCKSNKTGLYSIRKEGYLFWTGIKTNEWVDEKDGDKIWEHDDRELVQIFSDLVQYALVNEKPINEIIEENPLEGADKLSEQIIKNEWAKMPKAKQEDKVEYKLTQDVLDTKKEEIKIEIISGVSYNYDFHAKNKRLYVSDTYIPELISGGFIAEKKSKREEIADEITLKFGKTKNSSSWEQTSGNLKQIIISVLEKAGI